MSMFKNRGPELDLTHTKAMYWHRDRSCCVWLTDIGKNHLRPAGFTYFVGTGGNFLRVTGGPGLAAHDTGPLFEAVSGRKSHL